MNPRTDFGNYLWRNSENTHKRFLYEFMEKLLGDPVEEILERNSQGISSAMEEVLKELSKRICGRLYERNYWRVF